MNPITSELTTEQKKALIAELLLSITESKTDVKPEPKEIPKPVCELYLIDGTIHNPLVQTPETDVIMPVVRGDISNLEVSANSHLPTQRLLLKAESGINIEVWNECTREWQKAMIFCKLFIRIPNGAKSGLFSIGHSKTLPVSYFIYPKNNILVRNNGHKGRTEFDHMIRLPTTARFLLEKNTPITYVNDGEEMSFKERDITIDFVYVQ